MRLLAGLLAASALVVIVVGLNSPTWQYGFAYDDQAVIVDRAPAWQQGWSAFLHSRPWGTGRHAVVLSFDLNRSDPLTPRPFHVVNTALAAVATLLVFALARTLGLGVAGAFVGALLFAVHPVHVDAIASIVGRAELMAGTCVLACVLLHAARYPLWPLTVPLAGLLFLIGAESKESALALPAILVLYDCLLAPRRSRWRTLGPYAAYVLGAIAWAAIVAPNLGKLDPITYVDNPLGFLPAYSRIPRAASVLWSYLGLVLLPISLKPDRGFATTNPGLVQGLVAVAAWLVVGVACWRARRRHPRAVFLTLWFLAAFAVTSNVIYPIGTIMAERLLLTPSVGIVLLAGLAFERAWAGTAARRSACIAAAGACALLLAFAYDARARVWTSDAHYHLIAAMESPRSAKAHYNLGLERARAEDYAAAEAALRRALDIYPSFGLAAYYLAGVLIRENRPEDAIGVYEAYLALAPNDTGAMSQLISLQLSVDRYDDARTVAGRLIALDPDNQTYTSLLGTIEILSQSRDQLDPLVLERKLQHGEPEAAH
jgi:protein O-mannosyl-transferase